MEDYLDEPWDDAMTRAEYDALLLRVVRTPVPFAPEEAHVAIAEYCHFMRLKAEYKDTADKMLTPSHVVGTVWRKHLLATAAYATFCARLVTQTPGFFLHHDDTVEGVAQIARYMATYFLLPPASRERVEVWPVPPDVGPVVDEIVAHRAKASAPAKRKQPDSDIDDESSDSSDEPRPNKRRKVDDVISIHVHGATDKFVVHVEPNCSMRTLARLIAEKVGRPVERVSLFFGHNRLTQVLKLDSSIAELGMTHGSGLRMVYHQE